MPEVFIHVGSAGELWQGEKANFVCLVSSHMTLRRRYQLRWRDIGFAKADLRGPLEVWWDLVQGNYMFVLEGEAEIWMLFFRFPGRWMHQQYWNFFLGFPSKQNSDFFINVITELMNFSGTNISQCQSGHINFSDTSIVFFLTNAKPTMLPYSQSHIKRGWGVMLCLAALIIPVCS